MWHTILPIYGPLAIQGYGLMIAIGLLIFMHLIQKDYRFNRLKLASHLTKILLTSILVGLTGGRILFFLIHPHLYENFFGFLAFFQGGFSILGCIIALLLVLPLYLRYLAIPIIPFLDLIALYAPLLQSISRIGCFLAGCCYGLPTTARWGITYTAPDSIAPLHVCLHPTQLYSSIGLMLIFCLLYFALQHRFKKDGQLVCFYIFFVGLERCVVDIWRGDRMNNISLSVNQLIALGMMAGACIGFMIITFLHKKQSHS